ncbi:hypothetical protein Y032_0025g1187 [Ancylostoma ceylanicum]|uniref:Uncharacterized protein n=1 Tax=Ancylostoma ceylanicum TaxID=53326 RepID=A0A016UWK0_9BILA|nr:hypothetical protein Y032_0025g1187 [Ancylostoma ceylanicum]
MCSNLTVRRRVFPCDANHFLVFAPFFPEYLFPNTLIWLPFNHFPLLSPIQPGTRDGPWLQRNPPDQALTG